MLFLFLGFQCLIALGAAGSREGKFLSLFNIVKFQQGPCTPFSNSDLHGTCMTPSECEEVEGGGQDGSCAAGFGVCCVFTTKKCGGNVDRNCTYIKNPGSPSSTTEADKTCTYNIKKPVGMEDDEGISQIRLDFEATTKLAIEETGMCIDTLTTSNSMFSSPNAFPPAICGQLSGEHMYLEAADTSTIGTLAIATGADDTMPRQWNIKVTYIGDRDPMRAPPGCTRYFTGTSGQIKSLNFDGGVQIFASKNTACFRQEAGHCTIQFTASNVMDPNPFLLSPARLFPAVETETEKCARAWITIPGTGNICGRIFSDSEGATVPSAVTGIAPFRLDHITTNNDRNNDLTGFNGFNLLFSQNTC